jgi:hypothetical protein
MSFAMLFVADCAYSLGCHLFDAKKRSVVG